MSALKAELTVTINDDGSVQFDARKLPGTAAEILAELNELAELLSGDPEALVVEKHVHRHAHGHVVSPTRYRAGSRQ